MVDGSAGGGTVAAMFDDDTPTGAWGVARRALLVLIPVAAVILLALPLFTLDIDDAGVPDGAGPGWRLLRDWSAAVRDGDTTEAAQIEERLDEIRNNTGRRFLTAADGDKCWTLNADDPTPLPTLDEPEVCDNATPVRR